MSDPIDLAQFEGHTPAGKDWAEMFAQVLLGHRRCKRADEAMLLAAPKLLAELRTLRAADESRKRRDAAVDELVAAASELCEIAAISIAFGVMREDHDGPLPRTLHALAAIKGEAK